MTVAQTELVESPTSMSSGPADAGVSFSKRLRRYRLGLGLFVCASLMLFASFFSAYLVRRGFANYDYAAQTYSTEWHRLKLPVPLLSVATTLLLLASVAMEVARRKALGATTQRTRSGDQQPAIWIWVSAALTASFLVTVAAAWNLLRSNGYGIGSGAQASFFYVLTGVHSLHVAIGLLFIGYVALRRNWRTGDQHIALDLSAWYLYSMSALWLCIMLLMVL